MGDRLRDWAGMKLIIWGLWLVGERRARWLWERQTAYWTRLGEHDGDHRHSA